MDSLKTNKAKGNTFMPMVIRFNAGEESVEDIVIKTSDSLSSSPQQNDDSNWRKDFLHGSFFGRKRSGSIEGSSLINTTSQTNTNTTSSSTTTTTTNNDVGTWKKIKGKVTQAMEDIKSSKSDQITKTDDSDVESNTLNSSISDELSETIEITIKNNKKQKKNNQQSDTDDSDNLDIDDNIDIFQLDSNDPIIIKKSLTTATTLRNKNQLTGNINNNINNNNNNNINNNLNKLSSLNKNLIKNIKEETGKKTTSFLRRRKKDQGQQIISSSSLPTTSYDKKLTVNYQLKKKDTLEIESGVEMLEDMVLINSNNTIRNDNDISTINDRNDMKNFLHNTNETLNKTNNSKNNSDDIVDNDNNENNLNSNKNNKQNNEKIKLKQLFLLKLYNYRTFIFGFIIILCVRTFAIPDFMKGVIVCLFSLQLLNNFYNVLIKLLEKYTFNGNGNLFEKKLFKIPNYNNMPICEIPAAEEHKTYKSYSGWMNEINNYDPGNFHVTMTRSVYIKLDGSMLRLSNTNARIPKKSLWNEKEIEKKTINYTKHRLYNILGCRIEMCPKGLARKRHFSRKYPIQLTLTSTSEILTDSNVLNHNLELNDSQENLLNLTTKPDSQEGTGTTPSNIINHQSSSDSNDDKSDKTKLDNNINVDIDFAATIMNSDVSVLQKLQDKDEITINKVQAPCSDEIRILLFARNDREKEDWYRRFKAASKGQINDQDILLNDFVNVTDDLITTTFKTLYNNDNDLNSYDINDDKITATIITSSSSSITGQTAATSTTTSVPSQSVTTTVQSTISSSSSSSDKDKHTPNKRDNTKTDITFLDSETTTTGTATSNYDGLLMTSSASRGPSSYVRFMSRYQQVCSENSNPVNIKAPANLHRKNRREKKQEDELWKGIDQSLYLGPSGSVVWANVLIGRILYSCLNDSILLEKIQEFLQKKLGAIRLPSFMEDVNVAEIYLGEQPPLIHRVSQPLLDERGTWIDADLTYEGLMHMTITTKLNLLRLKKQQTNHQNDINLMSNDHPSGGSNAIYDSNAESTGASSSESESPTPTNVNTPVESQSFYSTPGSSRRLLRIVDRITASNLFQSATEISYIQRAMENMSTKIKLRVELKGLISRIVINMPPPPSDRIWIGFRGPPRLWITAKPAVGDHTFDWSIVTNVIENKLCDEVYKYLVYPNMVDIIVPFLGQPTYHE